MRAVGEQGPERHRAVHPERVSDVDDGLAIATPAQVGFDSTDQQQVALGTGRAAQ